MFGRKFKEKVSNQDWSGRLVRPAIYATVALPVLLVGAFSYLKAKNDLTEFTLSQRRSTAHLSAITLKEKFDRLKDLGIAFSTRPRVRDLVAEKRWQEAIQFLQPVHKDFPFVERIFIADTDGNLRADSPPLPNVRGINFSFRDWYQGVILAKEPYVSNVYTRTAEPRINVIAVATPIKGADQRLRGILVVQVALGTLFEWRRGIEVGPGGFVYFVDRKGQIAAHPKYSPQDSIVDYSCVPVVQRLMQGHQGVEVLYNPVEKEERVSAYEPVPGYGWGVIAQQPEKAAFASRDASLRLLLVVYGFVLVLGFILTFFILRALTARRRAEEELDRFFILSLDMLCIAGFNGYFKRLNPIWEKTLGYTVKELCSKPFIEFVHPDDREATLREAQKLSAGINVISLENRYRCKDGTYRWLQWNSMPSLENQLIYAATRDITERKRAEETLRKSEEKYRMLFDSIDVGVCTIEVLFDGNDKPVDYRFLEVNSSFEKQTGIQNAPGRRMREIAPRHEEHWFEIYGKIALTGEPTRFENQAAQLHRWYDVYAFRVGEPQKRQVAIHFTDITERKRVEREIEKLNESLRQHAAQLEAANKELEAFSYSVSHDLRAPLRSIDGFSQAVMEDCSEKLDEQGKDYLGRVRTACQRMAQLIDDLLNLSRVSRGEMRMETVDLSALAREIVSELQKQAPDRKVIFVIADNLIGKGDPRLLRVALENLLGNAWKYTSKRATARVEFGAGRQPDGKTAFFIRDDGAGFDRPTPASCSALFNGCTVRPSLPGPASGWPPYNASSTGTAAGSGRKVAWNREQLFISHYKEGKWTRKSSSWWRTTRTTLNSRCVP